MADKYSGSKNGFGNRTIINMLEQPPSQHALVGFPGLCSYSNQPATFDDSLKHSYLNIVSSTEIEKIGAEVSSYFHGAGLNATISGDQVFYMEFLPHEVADNRIILGFYDITSPYIPTTAIYNAKMDYGFHSYNGHLQEWPNSDVADSGATVNQRYGVAFNPHTGEFWSHSNGNWIMGHYPGNGFAPYIASKKDATWRPFVAFYRQNQKVTVYTDLSTCAYNPVGVVGIGQLVNGYVTGNTNNINLSGKSIITKARYNADISFNGTIKMLVSFDKRNTWYYWSGTNWVNSSGIDYSNAASIQDTMAALEMSRLDAGDTYLDFAIKGSANGYGDPILNRIDIEVR